MNALRYGKEGFDRLRAGSPGEGAWPQSREEIWITCGGKDKHSLGGEMQKDN